MVTLLLLIEELSKISLEFKLHLNKKTLNKIDKIDKIEQDKINKIEQE